MHVKRVHGLVAQMELSYAGTLHEEHARSDVLVQQVQSNDAATVRDVQATSRESRSDGGVMGLPRSYCISKRLR